MRTDEFNRFYALKAKLVFAFVMLVLFIRLISGTLYSQMVAPPLLFKQTEWLYKLILETGFLKFLTGNFMVAGLFDAALLFVPVIFVFTLKRIFAVLFTGLVVVYNLSFNIVTGHHYHGLVGLIVMSIPFWTKDENRFKLLWDGTRYYLLYIFASAALWKIARGSAFHPEQMVSILKAQQLDMLLQQPGSIRAAIAHFLINHTKLSHALLLANVLLQFSFIAGFFTKRFDDILLMLFILFVSANYFVMGIVSTDLLVLGVSLLSYKRLIRIEKWLTPQQAAENSVAFKM